MTNLPNYDMLGKKFGRLLVTEIAARTTGQNGIYWMCLCDCGTVSRHRGTQLRRGMSTSCGCLNADNQAARSVRVKQENRARLQTRVVKRYSG